MTLQSPRPSSGVRAGGGRPGIPRSLPREAGPAPAHLWEKPVRTGIGCWNLRGEDAWGMGSDRVAQGERVPSESFHLERGRMGNEDQQTQESRSQTRPPPQAFPLKPGVRPPCPLLSQTQHFCTLAPPAWNLALPSPVQGLPSSRQKDSQGPRTSPSRPGDSRPPTHPPSLIPKTTSPKSQCSHTSSSIPRHCDAISGQGLREPWTRSSAARIISK